MAEWFKKYRKRIFASAAACAVLAAAFWYGGSAPDSHGWTVDNQSSVSSEESQSAVTSQTVPAKTSKKSVTVSSSESKASSTAKTTSKPVNQTEKNTSASKVTTVTSVSEITAEKPPESVATVTVSSKPQQQVTAENESSACSFTISCSTVLDNMDKLDDGMKDVIPKDGLIFSHTEVSFSEGESVFDVLKRVCKENKIHMESSGTPLNDSGYIEGIANLYEFDCGSLSGWMYKVNGEFPGSACSDYILKNGDEVEIVYTCDFGKDVGGYYDVQN